MYIFTKVYFIMNSIYLIIHVIYARLIASNNTIELVELLSKRHLLPCIFISFFILIKLFLVFIELRLNFHIYIILFSCFHFIKVFFKELLNVAIDIIFNVVCILHCVNNKFIMVVFWIKFSIYRIYLSLYIHWFNPFI